MGPVLTGALSDSLSRRAMVAAHGTTLEPFKAVGLHQAMYIIPMVMLGAALVLFAATWTARRRSVAAGGPRVASAAP